MNSKRFNWFDDVENRPHPWPGLNWLTAMLYVTDVQVALEFYEQAFGFISIFEASDAKGNLEFVRMRYRGSNFTLSREGSFDYDGLQPNKNKSLPPIMFYVYVDDVNKIVEQANSLGCETLQPAHLEFWGDYKARLKDPFGYIWEFATRVS